MINIRADTNQGFPISFQQDYVCLAMETCLRRNALSPYRSRAIYISRTAARGELCDHPHEMGSCAEKLSCTSRPRRFVNLGAAFEYNAIAIAASSASEEGQQSERQGSKPMERERENRERIQTSQEYADVPNSQPDAKTVRMKVLRGIECPRLASLTKHSFVNSRILLEIVLTSNRFYLLSHVTGNLT